MSARVCWRVIFALGVLSTACEGEVEGPVGGVAGNPNVGGSSSPAGGTGTAGAIAGGGSGGSGAQSAGAAQGGSAGAPAGGTGGVGAAGGGGQSGAAGSSHGGSGGAPPKFCGNITTAGQVRSDFVEMWDQITPENEGKWVSVEGTRDQMDWRGLDRAHDYAKEHGITFKQHTFVWGSQQPRWIDSLPQSEQKAEVEAWIKAYCERYPDTKLIDVVNEPPPHTMPSYMAALGGAGASGYDWIVQAFKWAHQYCPNSILLLNDYNNIETAGDNSHTIDIVKRIKEAGAPIDAIGAQAHGAYSLPTDTVKMYIDKLATSTGLPVYITEYDINLADDAKQKSVMESQFTMFWNNPNVHGITLWGYVSGRTWLPNTGLMSASGEKRPALTWLQEFLKKQ